MAEEKKTPEVTAAGAPDLVTKTSENGADPPTLNEEGANTTANGDVGDKPMILVPEPFLRGICILPPRQKNNTSNKDGTVAGEEAAVQLPPLRPEEPVASIRAALTEVVGYSHLTKFRLVVERLEKPLKVVKRPSGKGATTASSVGGAGGSSSGVAGNNSGGGKKKSGKKNSGASSSNNVDVSGDGVVSPYTLKGAMVTVPPSLKTLEDDSIVMHDKKSEGKEEELVLDDFGDLSLFLPLLEEKEGNEDLSKETSGTNNKDNSVDASNYAIRVVLERYDLASIRDHVVRVRQLLEGNAPNVTSLLAEEEEVALELKAGEKQLNQKENENTNSEKENKAKEETPQNDLKKSKDDLAKKLPTFPPGYDLSFNYAASKGDLTNFYYLACGEEQTLLKLKSESTNPSLNGSSKKRTSDGWIDEMESGKKSNQRANGKKRSPSNGKFNGELNGHSNSTVSDTAIEEDSLSFIETERQLYNLNETTNIPATLRLSGYHPPPSHRRVLGDLAYLEVALPGGSIVHITAFALGFYVNRSTITTFDPTPAKEACYSHSLLDCLLQRSKPLRAAWSNALTASNQRAELLRTAALSEDSIMSLFRPAVSGFPNNGGGHSAGAGLMIAAPSTFTPRLDSVVVSPSWLVPLPNKNTENVMGQKMCTWQHGEMHKWNPSRAEEEMTSTFGMDVRGGGLRDWNEELQSAREMPVGTLPERLERARLVHKVMSDFGEAALVGVKAIFEGYITPMNPNEPSRSHVYLHNNIFFSRAVDAGLDTFKICQGDNAARKSASRDAHNMGVLHRLDIPGLHTLATVLIDYLGTRVVCQSIVPGILYGEKSHTLVYGAVEALSPLQSDDEMHKLLETSIGEGCMIATRTILSRPLTEERTEIIKKHRTTPLGPAEENVDYSDEEAKKKTITVCGPMEMKGIVGSDKRKYVLDCARLTPRDANWVSKSNGGTGNWEDNASDLRMKTNKNIPSSLDDDEWVMCVLRPELVTAYAEMKIGKFLRDKIPKKEEEKGTKKEGEKNDLADDNKVKEDSTTPKQENNTNEMDEANDSPKPLEATDGAQQEVVIGESEEEYIRSLQYNVNVFLPNTRSIEGVDEDAFQQLQKDEEEVRGLARHLWDKVLPNLTKEIKVSSGGGLQIPTDGKALTEFIHQRGINCRYLGRLAELASKEEQDDLAAEKALENRSSPGKLPRYRMPLCWLEILECEMVARAAKHVLDSYMTEQGGSSATQPAQVIASFLSAIVSIGEESAAETELRIGKASSREDLLDEEDANALTLFEAGGDGDAVPAAVRGRGDVWADIEREVGRRYRYTLSLYNRPESKGKDGSKSRALFMPLLRRICQRSGIRLVAKQYDLGGKCLCGGGSAAGGRLICSHPISPTDVLDVLPLMKHAAAVAGDTFVPCSFSGHAGTPSLHVLLSDAKAMYEAGHSYLNNGNFSLAMDYAQEAAAMYQRVVDTPLHTQIARCLKLSSAAHLHGPDTDLSLAAASKALTVAISLGGFDCFEALTAHMNMTNVLLTAGQMKKGLKHLRTMQFLMEIMAGPNYNEISTIYYKIGTQYHEAGRAEDALRFYKMAALKRNDDRMVDCIVARSSAMALARLGQFKEAYDCEKKSHQLYLGLFGEDHEATKSSMSTLIQFMHLAVEQGKVKHEEEQKRNEENAADAVADQIKADEDADEAKKRKKKNKKKKKKSVSSE